MQIVGTIPLGLRETTGTFKFKAFVCMHTLCVCIYILVGSWILTWHQPLALGVTKLHLAVLASVQSPSENTAHDSNG